MKEKRRNFAFLVLLTLIIMTLVSISKYIKYRNCHYNMGTIYYLCTLYAKDNDGNYPSSWQDTKKFIGGEKNFLVFKCPSSSSFVTYSNVDAESDYILYTNKGILAYEKLSNHKFGYNVVYTNAVIKWFWFYDYPPNASKKTE